MTVASRTDNDPTITCCVLAWNEVATLRPVIEDLLGALRDLGVTYELIVIDDGSTDGTGAAAEGLSAKHGIRVIHHERNQGLGGVYRTGFAHGRGKYLTFFPADGQFAGALLSRFFPLIENYDLALGNLPDREDSIAGKVLTGAERLLYRVLFGFVPRLEGVFMVRRSILAEIPLHSVGRSHVNVWELVIRASRGGYRHTGVSIEVRPRVAGASKVNNFRTVRANIVQLFKLWRRL